tara:strand:+ start:476 stop:871 length:396 start_codon:yes stop_codon:yes gene_type:complete
MPQYKIKSGDTLSQIAKSKGFTLKQLMGANKNLKDPNKIKAGATLQLPYSATSMMGGSSKTRSKRDVGTTGRGPYRGMSKSEMTKMSMNKKKTTTKPKALAAKPTKRPASIGKKKLTGTAGRRQRRMTRKV